MFRVLFYFTLVGSDVRPVLQRVLRALTSTAAMRPQAAALAFTLIVGLLAAGCGQSGEPKAPVHSAGTQANPPEPTNGVRSFSARGLVRELSTNGQSVVVHHEDIPGLMPRMTMEFRVRNTNELRGLRAGDAITFQVKATDEESWIEGITRVVGQAPSAVPPAGPSASSILHAAQLRPGAVMPDGELKAEDGRTIHLSQFQGHVLAFTFIFTRCPLPDFCPRMNQGFSRARQLLLADPEAGTNWQFLSISFDPEFDRPEVLARYARGYRGANADRWLFAAAPTNVLTALSPQLDFRYANDGGGLVHNLRTVVLDTEGRVFRQLDGNQWTAADLAQAMVEAGQPHGP